MIRARLLCFVGTPARVIAAGLTLLALAHCSEEGRAARFADPQLQDRLPPSSEIDAALSDDDELDASVPPAPDRVEDAGDEFVKYWDGSTRPTSDYVRHDAGDVDVRGSDVVADASAP
jgi:hypothetical protein